jgi:hypothetical protein
MGKKADEELTRLQGGSTQASAFQRRGILHDEITVTGSPDVSSETGPFGFCLNSTEVHIGCQIQHAAIVSPADVGDAFSGYDSAE